ncbi:hypothetical protein D3C77_769400 [compost metagenome]
MLLQHGDGFIHQFVAGRIHQRVVIVLGEFPQPHGGKMKAQKTLFFVQFVLDQAQQLLV